MLAVGIALSEPGIDGKVQNCRPPEGRPRAKGRTPQLGSAPLTILFRTREAPATIDSADGPMLSAEAPHAWNPDPEVTLSLLNDATDRKLVKPLLSHILFVADHLLPVLDVQARPQDELRLAAPTTLLTRDVPARAPPSPLLS